MAKRKPARAAKRAKKTAPKKAVRKAGTKKATRKTAPKKKARQARKAAPARRTRPANRRPGLAKQPRQAVKKKAAKASTARPAGKPKKTAARRPAPKLLPTPAVRPAVKPLLKKAAQPVGRKAPALNRARRMVLDDDIVMSPPSTLDRDRRPSAAKSGGRALHDRIERHHDTSPALTAGDVDADWESAESAGDEAAGGDNMTPDQDVVDEIGAALGVEYDDDEELQGGAEIAERDDHRWDEDE